MRPARHPSAPGLDRGAALRLALALAAGLTAAMAWAGYDDPALALMLGALRFCG